MERILITGGAGFIGSHLVGHFQGSAHVRVMDNFRSGHRRNLEGFDVELVEGSILDDALLADAMDGVDYVFHLAAMISVPESMEQPRECVRINTDGTLAVLEAAARAGVKKLLLASSAAIYGDNPLVPKTETMLPEPKSPYAVTKLDGEYYLAMFAATRGLATAALRFFNVFGPRQDPASAYAAAVPIFIAKALANDPITIFGDGEQTRDFIHVKDIVSALVHLAMESPAQGVFNCGYGAALSINSLAERIVATAASSSKILHLPERPGDVKHSRASVEKLHATGWRPVSSLDNGLADTLAWFAAQKR